MKLIDAVNDTLTRISESKVNSIDSTSVAVQCTRAVKDAYTALVSEATWSWCERVVTAKSWNADGSMQLDDYVTDVKRVYHGSRELVYCTTADFLRLTNYEGAPSRYTFLGTSIAFSPYPNESQRLDIRALVQYQEPIVHGDDAEIFIPKELESLLVTGACAKMALDHLQSADMYSLYMGEYAAALNQAKPRKNTSYKQTAIATN